MQSHGSAQNDARQIAIPTQGTSPLTTSLEQSINRDSVEQGNTETEKSLNKPLSSWDQVKLVQQAMNRNHKVDFDQWGSHVFGTTLSPHAEDGYTLVAFTRFFRDLLLFISKPKMAVKFDESVPYGHQMIETLSELFLELQGLGHYEEYAVYHGLSNLQRNDKPEFLYHAKEYLTGDDLQAVLAANGKGEEPEPKKSIFQIVQEKSDERTRAWAKQMDEGPHESKYFKTEEELITALDHFYPGHSWPTSKAIIVANRLMVENLDRMEEDRLSIEQETPEKKQKRLATDAVRHVLNLPTVGLSAVPKAAATKRKTKKPAPSRKSSPRKKA